MKKVLSLVLALAMVIGMSTMAFAWPDTYNTVINFGTFTQKVTTPATKTLPMTTSGSLVVPGSGTAPGWTITSSNRDILDIEAFMSGLTISNVAVGDTSYTLSFTPAAYNNTGDWLPVGNYTFKIVLDDGVGSTSTYTVKFEMKSAGGTTTETIPSTYKITGIADNWTTFVQWKDGIDPAHTFPKVTEETTMSFDLVAGMFYWQDQDGYDIVYATANTPGAYTKVRTTHLKDVKLRKTNTVNNGGTIKSLEIDGTVVKLKTVDYFLKCGNTDVSIDLDLVHKSSASGDKLYISFNIANEKIEVDSGDYSVDTTGHVYLQATSSVRDLEMEIGEGLSLFKGMGTDQKCYARVTLQLSAGDEKLFQQYSELSDVYTLYTVGVQSANVYAQFNDLDDTYFVYDENFKLLGTTTDKKLAFSNKYYLTTKKVDLAGTSVSDEDSEPASESTPTDIGNAGTGGGSTAVVNNYNPNTGA